jgi:hypothetical protein
MVEMYEVHRVDGLKWYDIRTKFYNYLINF